VGWQESLGLLAQLVEAEIPDGGPGRRPIVTGHSGTGPGPGSLRCSGRQGGAAMSVSTGSPGPRAGLYALVAAPLLYYAALLLGAALYPGYSHRSQYASELGAAGAAWPWVFNAGVIGSGLAAIVGAVALYRALRARGAGALVPALLALSIGLHGVGFLFGGWFPMPDERHGGFGLGLAVLAGPPLAAIALRRAPSSLRWVAAALVVNTAAMWALFALMMGAGDLVTRANVGLFQRAFSLTMLPWLALLGGSLLRWQDRRH
jgi:hypothetical membrane protein